MEDEGASFWQAGPRRGLHAHTPFTGRDSVGALQRCKEVWEKNACPWLGSRFQQEVHSVKGEAQPLCQQHAPPGST